MLSDWLKFSFFVFMAVCFCRCRLLPSFVCWFRFISSSLFICFLGLSQILFIIVVVVVVVVVVVFVFVLPKSFL